MPTYPQLSTGATCQYPLTKQQTHRTISNVFEDGSRITLEDAAFSNLRWVLQYRGITDLELNALREFFESVEGRLNSFTFLDPTANFLVWSENPANVAWQRSVLLGIEIGIDDPFGTQRASRLTNPTQSDLALLQTIAVPSAVSCCWSLYARSNAVIEVVLTRFTSSKKYVLTTEWSRVALSVSNAINEESSDFGITIPAGAEIDIFGMQVESQPAASKYVMTLNDSGIYPEARFESDLMWISADGPNSNSCQLTLFSRTS